MSSRHKVYSGLVLSLCMLMSEISCDQFCGNRTLFQEPTGTIQTGTETSEHVKNCSWSLVTPKKSVVFFKIDFMQLGSYDAFFENEENCLRITSPDQDTEYYKICNDLTSIDSFAVATNDLQIHLEVTSESYLSLIYSSYIINCSYDQLQCYKYRVYGTKTDKVCTNGMLVCGSLCRYGSVTCGEFCYDINKQRCDGIIDCPSGEDELGCDPHDCPEKIRCSNETKCLNSDQICNQIPDCQNRFDESSCHNFFCDENDLYCNIQRISESQPEVTEVTYLLIVLFAIMVALFVFLLCRCLVRRENVRRMMNHPLEVPLPPFTGPGEGSSTAEDAPFTEDDFKPGGEIYESYMANIEKIKYRRKNITKEDDGEITLVKPADSQKVIDKYFKGMKPVLGEDMAALATLKITRESCCGLRKTKSEERPITRLLFLDNKDDISDDSDEEENPTSSQPRKAHYRPSRCKSDSDYVRFKASRAKVI